MPTMTVAQNLFLGQEKFYNRLRGIYIAAQQFLQSLNFDVTPTTTVGLLGAAKKQMVEIARAVLHQAQVIIFDEPTAIADAGGEELFLRPRALAEEARRLDRLHLACAGGGAAAGRPHHGAARRQACRDRRRREIRSRADRAGHGRPRPLEHALRQAQDRGAPGGRAGPDRAESEDGADGEEQFAVGVRGPDHRRVRAGRRRAHRDLQDRRGRPEARLLPWRRDPAARQAGALPRAGAGGARRHRLCDRGPQGRGLLRDHVGRAQHLSRHSRQVSARPLLPVQPGSAEGRATAGSRG